MPSTKRNGHKTVKEELVASSSRLGAAIDPSGKIGLAKKEKSFQQRIEKMQLTLITKEVRLKKAVASGLKELVNAMKMEQLLAEHKVRPLSDYSHLKEIYEHDLRSITFEDLTREAQAKAENILTKGNKLSKEQEKVIRDVYALEAKANQLGIEQIREFLIIKGQIKETPEDKKRLHQKEEMVYEEEEAA